MEFLKNSHPKKGFTMLQLMLTIVVVSIVAAASVPIISRTHLGTPDSTEHGAYLCYYQTDRNGKSVLRERRYTGKSKLRLMPGYPKKAKGNKCKFEPPEKATYFTITAIGGGGGGGDAGWSPTKYLGYAHAKEEHIIDPTNGPEVGKYVCNELASTGASVRGIVRSYPSNDSKISYAVTCKVNGTETCIIPSTCSYCETTKTCTTPYPGESNLQECTWNHCYCDSKTCTSKKTTSNPVTSCKKYKQEPATRQGDCLEWSTGGAAPIYLAALGGGNPDMCGAQGACPSGSAPDNPPSGPTLDPDPNIPSDDPPISPNKTCLRYEEENYMKDTNVCEDGQSVTTFKYTTTCTQHDYTNCPVTCSTHVNKDCPDPYYGSSSNKFDSLSECKSHYGCDDSDTCSSCEKHQDPCKYTVSSPSCASSYSCDKTGTKATSCNSEVIDVKSNGGSSATCVTGELKIYPTISMSRGGKGGGPRGLDGKNGAAGCEDGTSKYDCGGKPSYVTVTLTNDEQGSTSATAYSASKGGKYRQITDHGECKPAACSSSASCSGGKSAEDAENGTDGYCSPSGSEFSKVNGVKSDPRLASLSAGGISHIYKDVSGDSILGGKIQVNYIRNTNKLSYGRGGAAGEVKTVIVRSFHNSDLQIQVGAGGLAGKNGNDGTSGSKTWMGLSEKDAIIIANGGAGGQASQPNAKTDILEPYNGTSNPGDVVAKEGEEGRTIEDIVDAKGFIQSSLKGDKFISDYKKKYGKGGNGGGIIHRCWRGMNLTIVDRKLAFLCNSVFPRDISWKDFINQLKTVIKKNYDYSRITESVFKDEKNKVPKSCTTNYDNIQAEDGLSGALLIRW